MTTPASDLGARSLEALCDIADTWGEIGSPEDQLGLTILAVARSADLIIGLTGNPDAAVVLHELGFALEKLASRPSGAIRDFFQRDSRLRDSVPAQELRAHIMLAFEIYRSVSEGISAAEAERCAVAAYAVFGERTVASLRHWRTNIHTDTAKPLFDKLMEVARRKGAFGLTFTAANALVQGLARESAQRLLPPRRANFE